VEVAVKVAVAVSVAVGEAGSHMEATPLHPVRAKAIIVNSVSSARVARFLMVISSVINGNYRAPFIDSNAILSRIAANANRHRPEFTQNWINSNCWFAIFAELVYDISVESTLNHKR
jgi:hypothetical protein